MDEKSLQSTSPLGAIDIMGTITTIHLIFIALFAIAAVLIIVWGTKRWRANKQAMAELEAEGRLQPVDADEPAPVTEPESVTPQPVERKAEPAATAPVVAPLSEPIPQPVPVTPPPPPIVEPQAEVIATPPVQPTPGARSQDGDLTRLKGLGPKVAARLAELNVTRIADLAALDDAQAAELDAQLGNFKGRMGRDKWIEQARLLDAGDIAGYEAQFGKLG